MSYITIKDKLIFLVGDYVSFWDLCIPNLTHAPNVACRYLTRNYLHQSPYLGAGLRIKNTNDPHTITLVHKDDAHELVRRLTIYRENCINEKPHHIPTFHYRKPGHKEMVQWSLELSDLQDQENEGRGVRCIQDIAKHLANYGLEYAISACRTDWDKIRNYPTIAHYIVDRFYQGDRFFTPAEV